ncbi:hypothetical protein [Sphingobium yanoikuyae]|uniref:hypothetical protein n=1 Tax=Sphingobium yanoikuyae TaxID=13690 RepID=UPI002FDE2536
MDKLNTYRARERGYVDDRMVEEGETFTTAAPKGTWMALLDEKGNEVPDPEPEPKADPSEAIEAVRREVTEKAQVVFEQQRADFEQKLAAEKARADDAEKQLSEAKAGFEKQLSESDTVLDKATQHIAEVEKERDALKAEVEKLKAAPAKAK